MKKNISINLQGLIFHIEEDGYELLGRYLAEVKAHFAPYRGHAEIVADIEGRIAELFSVRLSPTKQVISLADVEAMMAKMGRVSDFQTDTDDDDEAAPAADAFGSTASAGFGSTGPSGRAEPLGAAPAAEQGPRTLYRDMSHKKLAGVCAGLAQYFRTNPLWFRLGFLAALFIRPVMVVLTLDTLHLDRHSGLAALATMVYIVLWIALPKRYDAPTPDDSLGAVAPLATRKLFRDTDNGKIAGVAAGLAAYLRVDVTLIRLLLLLGLIGGGFTFLLYVVLWAVLPVARTLSDKMKMRGDDVTLEGYANNLDSFGAAPGTNRPLGTFLEDLAANLRPLVNFAASVIRIGAGALLTFIGFVLLMGLLVVLGVAVGLVPNTNNIMTGDVPAHVLFNGLPQWGILAGFLAATIPALALLLGGLGLLLRRSLLSRTVSLSLFGLWLLGVVGTVFTAVNQTQEFEYDAQVEQVERYPALTAANLLLDARHVDRQHEQRVEVSLAAADSGSVVAVVRNLSASGHNEAAARQTATTSIDYTVRVVDDSSLVVDDHFSFLPTARYRDQDLSLTIRLPRDRTFRLSADFASLLGDESFVNERRPEEPENYRYRLVGSRLQCLNCPASELEPRETTDELEGTTEERPDRDDEDREDEEDRGGGLSINFGKIPTFSTAAADYGSSRRNFRVADFRRVQVHGGYHVVIRPGATYRVQAAGTAADVQDLRVTQDGDQLEIRPPHQNSFFGGRWHASNKEVLITIEMPALAGLDLAGGVQADVAGFPLQSRLRVEQAGASNLRLDGTFGRLELELAGACRTRLSGTADELNADLAGACELAAADLQSRRADLDQAGMCKARVHVTETLKADAVGASVLEFSGNPRNVDTDAVGGSRVKRL